jgi:hypothetical protein
MRVIPRFGINETDLKPGFAFRTARDSQVYVVRRCEPGTPSASLPNVQPLSAEVDTYSPQGKGMFRRVLTNQKMTLGVNAETRENPMIFAVNAEMSENDGKLREIEKP